jgi:hypothetical protein
VKASALKRGVVWLGNPSREPACLAGSVPMLKCSCESHGEEANVSLRPFKSVPPHDGITGTLEDMIQRGVARQSTRAISIGCNAPAEGLGWRVLLSASFARANRGCVVNATTFTISRRGGMPHCAIRPTSVNELRGGGVIGGHRSVGRTGHATSGTPGFVLEPAGNAEGRNEAVWMAEFAQQARVSKICSLD